MFRVSERHVDGRRLQRHVRHRMPSVRRGVDLLHHDQRGHLRAVHHLHLRRLHRHGVHANFQRSLPALPSRQFLPVADQLLGHPVSSRFVLLGGSGPASGVHCVCGRPTDADQLQCHPKRCLQRLSSWLCLFEPLQ